MRTVNLTRNLKAKCLKIHACTSLVQHVLELHSLNVRALSRPSVAAANEGVLSHDACMHCFDACTSCWLCDNAGLLQVFAALASLQAKQGAVACSQRYQSLQSEAFSSCAWKPMDCATCATSCCPGCQHLLHNFDVLCEQVVTFCMLVQRLQSFGVPSEMLWVAQPSWMQAAA